jgi:hypothetical protein
MTISGIMKYLFTILLIVAISNLVNAGDILTLNNSHVFEGKVTKIKDCTVTFKAKGVKYQIPSNQVFSIEFKNKQDKVYLNYLRALKIDPTRCVNGRLDAARYHGKKSGHIALGFLFGPFAILGTALSDPTPQKGRMTKQMSKHQDLFEDPDYLGCYRKKAKGKLIGAESIGFGISLLMIILITPTYLNGQ